MRTKVEWYKGADGDGDVLTFKPKPTLIRKYPTNRMAKIEIPKMDGAVVQTIGISAREIEVAGVIIVDPPNFDNLVEAKKTFEEGIGADQGQLHIESEFGQDNSTHVYYKGIVDENGINWSEQKDMQLLEYRFVIFCADPTEYVVEPEPPPP